MIDPNEIQLRNIMIVDRLVFDGLVPETMIEFFSKSLHPADRRFLQDNLFEPFVTLKEQDYADSAAEQPAQRIKISVLPFDTLKAVLEDGIPPADTPIGTLDRPYTMTEEQRENFEDSDYEELPPEIGLENLTRLLILERTMNCLEGLC